jgi:predicted DNA-binding transcriptional regulator YafY
MNTSAETVTKKPLTGYPFSDNLPLSEVLLELKMVPEENELVVMHYRNWRGSESVRVIMPLSMEFEANDFHPIEQWFVVGFCFDKMARRHFAMKDIIHWSTLEEAVHTGWMTEDKAKEYLKKQDDYESSRLYDMTRGIE